MTDRVLLLRAAARHARERLFSVLWQLDERELFAPLGETLMWIVALADALDVLEQDPFSGIAHARNKLVHGSTVVRVSDITEQGPWSSSPLRGDVPRFTGLATAKLWGFVDDPDPGSRGKHPNREASYDRAVAKHALPPLIDRALDRLGVDVASAPDYPLAPRRPRVD